MEYVAILFICFFSLHVFWRKAKSAKPEMALDQKPQREATFQVADVDAFLKRLINQAKWADYALEIERKDEGKLVFSDAPDTLSFGFFYSVVLGPTQDGTTAVTVGITSRVMKMEIVAARKFEKFTKLVDECLTEGDSTSQ